MTPAAQQSLDHRLHTRLQYDSGTFAQRMKEIWHTMSEDEREEAMGWMMVYEHMLNNWERK